MRDSRGCDQHPRTFPAVITTGVAIVQMLHLHSARAAEWTSVGAGDAAQVTALAVCPADPARLFVTSQNGGVYRSDNRADSWTLRSSGIPLDLPLLTIEPSLTDRDAAWVGGAYGAVFHTVDGGDSWTLRGAGVVGDVTSLLALTFSPTQLLAGTDGHGIFKTTDEGASWRAVNPDMAGLRVMSLTQQPGDTAALLAGSWSGVLRSTDHGETWQSTEGAPTQRLVEWSRESAVAYASPPFVRSTDTGRTWLPVHEPVVWWDPEAIAFAPSDPAVVLVGGSPPARAGSFPLVARSTDGGATFEPSYSGPITAPSLITGLAVDGATSSRVYFATSNTGIPQGGELRRSDAGGLAGSWVQKRTGLQQVKIHGVRAGAGMSIYARTVSDFWASANGGASWSRYDRGGVLVTPYTLSPNAGTSGIVYEAGLAGTWVFGQIEWYESMAQRSTSSGASWTSLTGVPIGDNPTCTAIAAQPGGEAVYVWTRDIPARLYRSDDAGGTFSFVTVGPRAYDGAVDPTDASRVFLLTSEAPQVRLSTDGGVTWQGRSAGLPQAARPIRLLMHSSKPANLLVVYETAGVFESTDGGVVWSRRASATPRRTERLEGAVVGHVVADAAWKTTATISQVFLATSGGPFVEGAGFVMSGLPTQRTTSIAYSPAMNRVFLGTSRHGLFQMTPPVGVQGPENIDRTARGAEERNRLLVAGPNPMRSFLDIQFAHGVPESSGAVTLKVFDVSGRLIRTLIEGHSPHATTVIRWDGRNETSQQAGAGVYFVRLTRGAHEETCRVTLLR